MKAATPLGALGRGFLAGAAGTGTEGLFFQATSRLAPKPPPDAFRPPEHEQLGESPTETVARRWVGGLMARGQLTRKEKARIGQVIPFAFGAAWGGIYGLLAETFPFLRTPLGGASYGSLVWAASNNALLPAFRLSGPPQKYPLKSHAYLLAAHVAYGLGLWTAYEVLRPRWLAGLAGGLWSLRAQRRVARRLPGVARPAARRVIRSVLAPLRTWRPDLRGAVRALS
jgi:hypothetical protein